MRAEAECILIHEHLSTFATPSWLLKMVLVVLIQLQL